MGSSIKYSDYSSPGEMRSKGLMLIIIGFLLSAFVIGLYFLAKGIVLFMYSSEHPIAVSNRMQKYERKYGHLSDEEILTMTKKKKFMEKEIHGFINFIIGLVGFTVGVAIVYPIYYFFNYADILIYGAIMGLLPAAYIIYKRRGVSKMTILQLKEYMKYRQSKSVTP